ncbi:retrotransposable element Tf2 [Tanacetum coccineum]
MIQTPDSLIFRRLLWWKQMLLGLTTPFQTKWLPKLLGFDYEISYNKGTENIVADALSRLNSDSELNAMVLSTVTSDLLSKIKTGYGQDTSPQKIIQQLREGTSANNKYQWERNILKRKGKLVVGSDEQLRATIVQHYHADATDLAAHPGLLQPLPIPERIWSDISMDFIVGLPRSQGKTVIFVVVDRLSKYAHFVALSHPYTASSVAQAFLDSVYKLHGLPDSIVSDRDSVFMSHFWQSLFKILKVELKMSTAYHPQTDGQTEAVNYVSPYEVVYGQIPPLHNPYVAGESAVESVDRSLQARERAIEMLQFHIKRAQDRMKKYADLKRSEREFEVGMWVYLKLQPHRQVTIRHEAQNKLSSKYYGPFMIVEKIGVVAYKLELPSNVQPVLPPISPEGVKVLGNSLKMRLLPHCGDDGLLSVEPERILNRRIGKLNNKAAVYVLVTWAHHGEEDATWELAGDFIKRFPDFFLYP